MDDNGLVAADLFLQLALDYESRAVNHPSSPVRRKARDAFQHTLDYAAECKARHITALPGALFDGESRRDSTARAAEELAWRVAEARAYRIVFAIEPHIGSFATTPKRTLDLLSEVPGLTLTLDYGHFVPRGIPEKEVDRLIPHTSHFHARGTSRKSGSTSVADNTLNWRRIVRAMRRTGYKGWIELEYGGNNITDTVLLRDHLRALGA